MDPRVFSSGPVPDFDPRVSDAKQPAINFSSFRGVGQSEAQEDKQIDFSKDAFNEQPRLLQQAISVAIEVVAGGAGELPPGQVHHQNSPELEHKGREEVAGRN